MTILAFDSEQLLPTHQTPGPALIQILDGTRTSPWAMKKLFCPRERAS